MACASATLTRFLVVLAAAVGTDGIHRKIGLLLSSEGDRAKYFRPGTLGDVSCGAFLALRHLATRNATVVPELASLPRNMTWEHFSKDTKGIPKLTIKGYRRLLAMNVHGLLGPPWSTDSELVGHMSTLDKVPVVGFYAPSVRLGNGKDFPFFNRVNPSTKVQAQAVVELMYGLEFNHFAALYERSDTYLHFLEELDITLRAMGGTISALHEAFFLEWDKESTDIALENIRNSGARVIVGAFTFYQLELVMACAMRSSLTGPNFVWMGVDFTITAAGVYHARPFLKEVMQGFFGFEYASPRTYSSFHRFVASWEEAQVTFCHNTTPGESPPRVDAVASWAYDAVIALGLALAQVEDPRNGTSVQNVLSSLSFTGSSGPVAFNDHARDVQGMYVRVFNFQYGPNDMLTEVVISEYPVSNMAVRVSPVGKMESRRMPINYSLIRWGNGSLQRPDTNPKCPTGTAWNTQSQRCAEPCDASDLVFERTECDSHTLLRTGTVEMAADASCSPEYDIGPDRQIEFNCDHIPTNSDLYLAMTVSALCVICLIYFPALLYTVCSTRKTPLSTSFYLMTVLQFCGAALCTLSAFYFAGEAHRWRCVGQLLLYMLGCFVALGFTLLKLYWLSLGNAPKEWVLQRMSRPLKVGFFVLCLYLAYAIAGLVGEQESDGGRRAMIYPSIRNEFPGSPSAFDDYLCEASSHAYQVVGCLLYGLLYGCGLALAFYTHRNRRNSSGLDTGGYMFAAVCIAVLLLIPLIVWMQGSGAICEAQFSVSTTTVYLLFCISPIAVCVILYIIDYLSFTAARRAVMSVMHDRDKALALRTLNDDLLRAYDDLRSTTLRRRSHRKSSLALARRESLKGLGSTVGARITGEGPRTRTTAESSEGAEEEEARTRQQRMMIEHYKTRRSMGIASSSMRVQVGTPRVEPSLASKIGGALRATVRLRRIGGTSPTGGREHKARDSNPAQRANPGTCATDQKPASPLRKASLAAALHINGMVAQRSSSAGKALHIHTDLPPFARASEEQLGVLPQHVLSSARLAEFDTNVKRAGRTPVPGYVIRLLLAEARLMPRSEKRGKLTMVAAALRDARYTLKHFHDDIVEIFGPELRLYLGHASLHCRPMSGRSVAEEYKRTMGALFALYWLYRLDDKETPMSEGLDGQRGFCFGVDADWLPPRPDQVLLNLSDPERLAGASPEAKRHLFFSSMNWGSVQQLLIDANLLVRNPDGSLKVELQRTAAMLSLTAIHDIMKVKELLPTVDEAHAPYCGYLAGEVIYDHDVALGYVLEHDPGALPCFECLNEEQRRAVSFTQAELGFNHGWLVQAEAPPGATFSRLKAVITDTGVDQADIAFYFVHWLTDLAGAEPTPLHGAEKFVIKFPQAVLTRLIDSIPMVERLATMPPTTLMQEYLVQSWPTEGLNRPPPSGRSAIALMRLVMQAQTLEYQQSIVEAFEMLSDGERAVLVEEMALSGIENEHYSGMPTLRGGPAFLLYYSPAFLRHCAQEDATMALCILAEIYREARGLWPLSADRQGQGVSVHLGAIKSMSARGIMAAYDRGEVWLLVQTGCQDGVVEKRNLADLPAFLVKKKARVLKLWPSRWRTEAETSLTSTLVT